MTNLPAKNGHENAANLSQTDDNAASTANVDGRLLFKVIRDRQIGMKKLFCCHLLFWPKSVIVRSLWLWIVRGIIKVNFFWIFRPPILLCRTSRWNGGHCFYVVSCTHFTPSGFTTFDSTAPMLNCRGDGRIENGVFLVPRNALEREIRFEFDFELILFWFRLGNQRVLRIFVCFGEIRASPILLAKILPVL